MRSLQLRLERAGVERAGRLRPFEATRRLGYRRLVERIRAEVTEAVPAEASVLVVSRGDRSAARARRARRPALSPGRSAAATSATTRATATRRSSDSSRCEPPAPTTSCCLRPRTGGSTTTGASPSTCAATIRRSSATPARSSASPATAAEGWPGSWPDDAATAPPRWARPSTRTWSTASTRPSRPPFPPGATVLVVSKGDAGAARDARAERRPFPPGPGRRLRWPPSPRQCCRDRRAGASCGATGRNTW